MNLQEYIISTNDRYMRGNATEHSYRPDLQNLIESVVPEVRATNEPKRQKCGAPDYTLTKDAIEVGYIEAKDIGDKDLYGEKKTGNKEQFDRYKNALPNLIFTDYLTFLFYRKGELVAEVSIGEVTDSGINPLPENFSKFENLLKDFSEEVSQTIENPQQLAQMMAGKARLLSDIIEKSLVNDDETEADSTLKQQMEAFKHILIHDITPKQFADVYAQTIAYGMFAARLHDPTLDNFSRQEAAELIPRSNPFLRKLFGYIAGPEIDERILWVVDDLVKIFLACNVRDVLKGFGSATRTEDPIIHFYETFLAEYDPKLRKSRGVWYTPTPVVDFIVRAVDDILKSDFNLEMGLADTSKTTIKVDAGSDTKSGRARKVEKEVHRVQVLDPATGTGTFLASVISYVYKQFKGQEGIWSSYAENDLLPRLNGFELLMASYAMAHLKLDLLLGETGYQSNKQQRMKVYLTNSLEEAHPDTGTLFASWLSTEANEANHVKRDTPVMCVIGNPPYSAKSVNNGEWITDLMGDYKKEPGGKVPLQERNPRWINDDYVKFIRYGQHFIKKNGSGVLAFITPHGFLDNPTFRGMRWSLLDTYDKIYTIDLHGNSNIGEKCPDGSKDENVFDIKQGVAITLLVKDGSQPSKKLAKVYHHDLYGKRKAKYEFLDEKRLADIAFTEVEYKAPNYLMVPKDLDVGSEYEKGFSIAALFEINGVGITTAHDDFVIKKNKKELIDMYKKFQASERDAESLHADFNVKKKTGWDILEGYDNIKHSQDLESYILPVSYRPFDSRYIFYEDKLVWRTVRKVMKHFYLGDNVGLVSARSNKSDDCDHFYISKNIMETKCGERTTQSSIFPLYQYIEEELTGEIRREPNFDDAIISKFAKGLGIKFTPEETEEEGTFTSMNVLDYIYAVLHSPTYREKYKSFLKQDFPRVPYPDDIEQFWKLVEIGGEIRGIHLLESDKVNDYITSYPVGGSNEITRKLTLNDIGFEEVEDGLGKVWINDDQYFDGVPKSTWEYQISGYQPAQKWLKDRRGSKLNYSDILHYQKIIVALKETSELASKVDEVLVSTELNQT